MNDKKQEESDLKINWKAFGIISIILVSVHIWGISGGYDWISENSPIYRDMKISMMEPSISDQCWELIEEQTRFKNFLGLGVIVTQEELDELSFVDYEYYQELESSIDDLLCHS